MRPDAIVRRTDGDLFCRMDGGVGAPDRPIAVLVHGLVISSHYMERLLDALTPSFRVYAPDLPGFGRSPKPHRVLDVAELADALAAWMASKALPPAVVVGNSFGCQVIAELAARHPERTRALVMLAPTIDAQHRRLTSQVPRWCLDGLQESPLLAAILADDFLHAGVRRFLGTLKVMMDHAIEQVLPRVEAPVLLLRGTQDTLVSRAWLEVLARRCRGMVAEVEGGTHALNYSRARETAALIDAFVGQDARVEPMPRR